MLVKGEVGAATGVADPNSGGMVGATKLSAFKLARRGRALGLIEIFSKIYLPGNFNIIANTCGSGYLR
jgi:hypothetical protein